MPTLGVNTAQHHCGLLHMNACPSGAGAVQITAACFACMLYLQVLVLSNITAASLSMAIGAALPSVALANM
eukprot:scaffold152116_cov21-Tisochrysis_lutea.AAC.2